MPARAAKTPSRKASEVKAEKQAAARVASKALAEKRAREAERKARMAAALAEETARLEREATKRTDDSLVITQAKNKARDAERRAQRALQRAENTEALLAQEKQRREELEELLATAPGEGKFDGDRAHQAATGVPIPGRRESQVKKTARANVYEAFDLMGGVDALVVWGKTNPTEFYRIWARLIPVEVEDETKKLPLETLLEMLSDRAGQTVEQAAREIGEQVLADAKDEVDVAAAAALFEESQK